MHGRCPVRKSYNIHNIRVVLRDNIHDINLGIYGFSQKISISANIEATLLADIIADILMDVKADINMSFSSSELVVVVDSFASANINNDIMSNIQSSVDKYMSTTIKNEFVSEIDISIASYVSSNDIDNSILIGTIDVGGMISDIQDLDVSDIENLTVEDITKPKSPEYGVYVDIIKENYIIDVQDLYIIDVENLTVENFTLSYAM